jgi:pyruvate dehydrogenase E1 component beta subunit
MYIDDRWLYSRTAALEEIVERPLIGEGPVVRRPGSDVTLVGTGFSSYLCEQAAERLDDCDIDAEVIDVRVVNPFDPRLIIESVTRTGALCVVDGGWAPAGFAAEVIASSCEAIPPTTLTAAPLRITLPFAPAPASRALEECYYPTEASIVAGVQRLLGARSPVSTDKFSSLTPQPAIAKRGKSR